MKKIKLTKLNSIKLETREMDQIKGGGRECCCSCDFADEGGSSINDNRNANYNLGDDGGYSTTGCCGYYKDDGGTQDYLGAWEGGL